MAALTTRPFPPREADLVTWPNLELSINAFAFIGLTPHSCKLWLAILPGLYLLGPTGPYWLRHTSSCNGAPVGAPAVAHRVSWASCLPGPCHRDASPPDDGRPAPSGHRHTALLGPGSKPGIADGRGRLPG